MFGLPVDDIIDDVTMDKRVRTFGEDTHEVNRAYQRNDEYKLLKLEITRDLTARIQ